MQRDQLLCNESDTHKISELETDRLREMMQQLIELLDGHFGRVEGLSLASPAKN